jgi:hypothetical protein
MHHCHTQTVQTFKDEEINDENDSFHQQRSLVRKKIEFCQVGQSLSKQPEIGNTHCVNSSESNFIHQIHFKPQLSSTSCSYKRPFISLEDAQNLRQLQQKQAKRRKVELQPKFHRFTQQTKFVPISKRANQNKILFLETDPKKRFVLPKQRRNKDIDEEFMLPLNPQGIHLQW